MPKVNFVKKARKPISAMKDSVGLTLGSSDLLASFPSAFAAEIRWTVNLQDPMPDGHERKLFRISGVKSVSSGTPCSGPQVECCLPLNEATPERIKQLAAEISEANARVEATGHSPTPND